MSADEKTPAENPFAKVVQRIVRQEFDAFERRAMDREERITAQLLEILGVCRAERDSDRLRIDELERRVSNLEEIVRSRADTEPPPPPSGLRS